MKTLRDPDCLLTEGLAAIRAQFKVPPGFSPELEAAAGEAARRRPDSHRDCTGRNFVTLDPATSTDLDQAFTIERSGADMVLHYAIADVGWFVRPGEPLDLEARTRGTTCYLPDGKASLYPRALSERAASLLPDGDRAAVVFTVRIDPDGNARLQGVERWLIRSRAKLAYETARDDELPDGFAEIARRIALAEERRGAARVDPPEQEVSRDADGHFTLQLRPQVLAERRNATLSLATNLAVAEALWQAGTGLFRVMAGPGDKAILRLRGTAKAFGLDWPDSLPLAEFEKRLDPASPRESAFLMAARRGGNGASYVPFMPGERPWHAAMAASYCHVTAPLRRLADRHVIAAALAVANGLPVPDESQAAFAELPRIMARAEARDGQVDRAVVDLAEAAILAGREGERFSAVVTDLGEAGARVQLCDLPVVARVTAHGALPGDPVTLRLIRAEPARREIAFERIA
ncbi:RNB domain-containing ribonuclease [Novosphingobium sp. TH158]|uniref:RNB domain-containing ribonuclease n=1 Tax=Novosphingobium sp. TH158 TaxID=2067455 RepID=UPI000C7B9076|nr:RNB domain-containing ribonuclease [Novosphingobium sp. TH158]PLK27281.1 RNB domain-containing ribonuclease [Novosphingobium sp. TH158]